jgi:hypothetical protein
MNFQISLPDINREGTFIAKLASLPITNCDNHPETVIIILYEIEYPVEKLTLYRILSSLEWYPSGLNTEVPDYVIKRTMTEIEKFETENFPSYLNPRR